MPDRIVVDVIEMPVQIVLIAEGVFPEASLPDVSIAAFDARGGADGSKWPLAIDEQIPCINEPFLIINEQNPCISEMLLFIDEQASCINEMNSFTDETRLFINEQSLFTDEKGSCINAQSLCIDAQTACFRAAVFDSSFYRTA